LNTYKNEEAKMKRKQKRSIARDYAVMGLFMVTAVFVLFVFPDKSSSVIEVSKNYFLELIMILPAIMVIIGLFSIWVPKEMVVKYMGKASGIKGILLAFALGMLPTGPLYIAFPMASALFKKGAKVSNVIIFISAWACIKLPQELVEIQFLGLRFAMLRLGLTIFFVIGMGYMIEKLIFFTECKNIKKS
jgi:uncharacterized membrane protein YraQ (UPF0718 family)